MDLNLIGLNDVVNVLDIEQMVVILGLEVAMYKVGVVEILDLESIEMVLKNKEMRVEVDHVDINGCFYGGENVVPRN